MVTTAIYEPCLKANPTNSLLIAHLHLMVRATNEWFLSALITSSGSH